MAKCKWCGEYGPVNTHGYCENCNANIRDDIIRNKSILQELAARANPELSEEEKKRICSDADTAYNALLVYKDKKVPYFKSELEPLRQTVFSALGMSISPAPAAAPSSGHSKQNAPTKRSWIFAIAFAVVGIVLIYAFLSNWGNPAPDRNLTLQTYAQSFVKERLISPSSAKFPWSSDDYKIVSVSGEDDMYAVSSYVDADNDFGANLRIDYTVTLLYNAKLDQCSLVDISFT